MNRLLVTQIHILNDQLMVCFKFYEKLQSILSLDDNVFNIRERAISIKGSDLKMFCCLLAINLDTVSCGAIF